MKFEEDKFEVAPIHCGKEMMYRGMGFSWEGNFAIVKYRFLCVCGLVAVVETRTFDGGPLGVRAKNEEKS